MANEENTESVASISSEQDEEQTESKIEAFLLKIDTDLFASDQDGDLSDPSNDIYEVSDHDSDESGSKSPIPPDPQSPGSLEASNSAGIPKSDKFLPRRKTRSSDSGSDIQSEFDYDTFSDLDDFFDRPVPFPGLDIDYDMYVEMDNLPIMYPALEPDPPKLPLFEIGKPAETECQICLVVSDLHLRTCCTMPVCDSCLQEYFSVQVNQKIVKVPCPNPQCHAFVSRDEIIFHLDGTTREKFHRFLIEANKEPHMKTCPRCSHLFSLDKEIFAKTRMNMQEAKVSCPECFLVWCFPCHAPWHEGISCREYKRGDKLLKAWAREKSYGQNNAQRCPKCRVYIQRSSGCDHMTCKRCKTEFCYRCGKQFRSLKFIGDHYSRLSVFGCKYRFKPDNPVQRRMVRGAVLGGKILAAPVLATLAVGAGGLLIAVGTVALPVYGSYKLHKKIQRHKKEKKVRKWRKKLVLDFELQYRVVVRPPTRLVPREPTTMPMRRAELDILY
ncbi:E3 ubiquitin-protein ligase RNF217-like [Glandiceps talaboti]